MWLSTPCLPDEGLQMQYIRGPMLCYVWQVNRAYQIKDCSQHMSKCWHRAVSDKVNLAYQINKCPLHMSGRWHRAMGKKANLAYQIRLLTVYVWMLTLHMSGHWHRAMGKKANLAYQIKDCSRCMFECWHCVYYAWQSKPSLPGKRLLTVYVWVLTVSVVRSLFVTMTPFGRTPK